MPRYVNVESFKQLCDHTFPHSLPSKKGDKLFVHLNVIHEFVNTALPTIQVPFVLITVGCDLTVPFHILQSFKVIIKHPMLIHWFSQNCTVTTPKLSQLPIGVDYGTYLHESSIEEQDTLLHRYATTPCEKLPKCYGNFHFHTKTYYGWDRIQAKEKLPSECINYESNRISRDECWQTMHKYKFIVSPFGDGLDCYRTWEALILGSYPIVRSSDLNPLYEGLPVMIVNDWSEVTREKLDSFVPNTSSLERLTFSYWQERLNSVLSKSLGE
jgi:hypothetical protein